jgi:maleylpyruvate isomerase
MFIDFLSDGGTLWRLRHTDIGARRPPPFPRLGKALTCRSGSSAGPRIAFVIDGRRRAARGKGINGYRQPVSADPLVLLAEVDRATARLLDTATALDSDVSAPSLLPGWTRGHVLTHVARNADGLVNLLNWARTGERTPQYPSWERREADIEAGAARPLPELLDDIRASAERFSSVASSLDAADWGFLLDLPGGPQPAALIPWRRLREVEVHHVDLGAGYGPADWPDSFAQHVLHEVVAGLDGVSLTLRPTELAHPLLVGSGGPPEVAGPSYALAAWLAGRSRGADLSASGPLPSLPEWI